MDPSIYFGCSIHDLHIRHAYRMISYGIDYWAKLWDNCAWSANENGHCSFLFIYHRLCTTMYAISAFLNGNTTWEWYFWRVLSLTIVRFLYWQFLSVLKYFGKMWPVSLTLFSRNINEDDGSYLYVKGELSMNTAKIRIIYTILNVAWHEKQMQGT